MELYVIHHFLDYLFRRNSATTLWSKKIRIRQDESLWLALDRLHFWSSRDDGLIISWWSQPTFGQVSSLWSDSAAAPGSQLLTRNCHSKPGNFQTAYSISPYCLSQHMLNNEISNSWFHGSSRIDGPAKVVVFQLPVDSKFRVNPVTVVCRPFYCSLTDATWHDCLSCGIGSP